MDEIARNRLKMLDARHGKSKAGNTCVRLKVFYGWSKINKIQKREAIAIAFENEELAGDECRRSGKSLRKTMDICYERYQTEEEMSDAPYKNRVFTVYHVFLDDKAVNGSLARALEINSESDKNHVGTEERSIISERLRTAFIAAHRDYREPELQLEIPFDKD